MEKNQITKFGYSGHPKTRIYGYLVVWVTQKVWESQMAGAHATIWIACRMPDWLYFGNFDLVPKQIKMAGTRSK
jgi:hypothetical protein